MWAPATYVNTMCISMCFGFNYTITHNTYTLTHSNTQWEINIVSMCVFIAFLSIYFFPFYSIFSTPYSTHSLFNNQKSLFFHAKFFLSLLLIHSFNFIRFNTSSSSHTLLCVSVHMCVIHFFSFSSSTYPLTQNFRWLNVYRKVKSKSTHC